MVLCAGQQGMYSGGFRTSEEAVQARVNVIVANNFALCEARVEKSVQQPLCAVPAMR